MIKVPFLTTFTVSIPIIMGLGANIRTLREQRSIKQQEIADLIGMHRSNYSKIETEQREISVSALDKVASFFNVSIDQLVHLDGELPQEVEIEDKTTMEQLKLMQELDEEERSMIFKMIDSFLTKKKFKDFFNKNVASL